MSVRRRGIVGTGLLALMTALASGCGRGAPKTARVVRGDVFDFVAAPGRVEGEGELIRLGPRLPGRLAEVRVREGDAVHRGDVLAVLENADVRARLAGAEARLARLERGGRPQEVAAAEADVAAARARAAEAENASARAARLLAQGVTSPAEAEAAAHARESAAAELRAAEQQASLVRLSARDEVLREAAAELEAARDAVLATQIVAPVDGVIVKRHLLAGESIGLGATVVPVVSMTSGGRRWVRLEVPEMQSGQVAPGQEVTVTADAFPGQVFHGTVRVVGVSMGRKSITVEDPRALADTEVLEVRAELDDAGDRLPYELRVDGVIAIAAEKGALVVPWNAVRRGDRSEAGDKAIVAVRREGSWRDVEVVVGASNELRTAIRSGLSEGDEVRLEEAAAGPNGRPLTSPPRG